MSIADEFEKHNLEQDTKPEKRAPLNTERQAQEDPMSVLASAMIFGNGPTGAIERQEAHGQVSFVGSDTLPTDIDAESKIILETFRVKFLGPVEGDSIFQYVELPEGWEKKTTDHSMWSDLVDDKGRVRALIFYKAAHYDRSSYLRLTSRFKVDLNYDLQEEGVTVVEVTDSGEVVFSTEPVPVPPDYLKGIKEVGKETFFKAVKERSGHEEASRATALVWLEESYPKWKNPGVYW